jgi:hypothetical protein
MIRYNHAIVHRLFPSLVLIVACGFACLSAGCVRRTVTITSDPSGALCWLNGREVGRTPLTVDFVHYGTYDVVLTADGHEALLTSGKADAPLWDNVPLDLFAEMVPGEPHVEIAWHYTLEPLNNDPVTLVERAKELRHYQAETSPPPADAATMPATAPADTQPATAPASEP